MRIDSHQHFWRYQAERDAWISDQMSVLKRDFLPSNLIPELEANGMDGCVAVQADQSEQETLFLLDLADRHSTIKGVVGWVDLRSQDLPARLRSFSKYEKLRGFRHIVQAEPDDRFMLGAEFLRGIECLSDFNFTYDILIYPKQLPAALGLVERFPKQRFVVDHMAKPSIKSGDNKNWSDQIRAIAANPNAYCKVSGLITEADWKTWRAEDFKPYLDVVFDAFGCDRLMFGSDWPVCLLAGTYRQVKELIGDYVKSRFPEQQQKIFGDNAARFYGLRA
jgi:L-fuconolactonase